MKIFRIFGTTLEAKTHVLVFNIASGLLSLAVVSYVYYFSLKYDYDVLFTEYSQSLISLEELHKSITNAQNILIAHRLEEAEIVKAQETIIAQWENYRNIQNNLVNESYFTHFLLKTQMIHSFFKFIRIRQTGPNWTNSNLLSLWWRKFNFR